MSIVRKRSSGKTSLMTELSGPTHVLAVLPPQRFSFLVPVSPFLFHPRYSGSLFRLLISRALWGSWIDTKPFGWHTPRLKKLWRLLPCTQQNLQARDEDHVANIDDILPCIHWATCNMDRQNCLTRFCASYSACVSCQRAERETSHASFEIPHFTTFCVVIMFRMI